jgi:SPP1 family phage portal protein
MKANQMYNSEDITKLIELNGDKIIPKIIEQLIKDHKGTADKMKEYYLRYTGDDVPIMHRKNKDKAGINMNNKIHCDFEGTIIDEIKGYIWGHPIKTEYQDEDENAVKNVNSKIELLETKNNLDSLDEATGELSSICGYAGRLIYFDTNGDLKIMNTKPWQTIFIINNSTEETDYALIYYPWDVVDYKTGQIKKTIKAEFYDKEFIRFYIKDSSKYVLEQQENKDGKKVDYLINVFDYVPVIKFKANNMEQSDLKKVVGKIDSFDELISDAQNEIQEFVHAYLKTTGAFMTPEERIAARQSGVFNLPDKDADVDFITKNIQANFFESQKKTLREEIFSNSKTVDMYDEKFNQGGPESGESRKWKLLQLEFKAISKERKFTEGLRNMWKVITSAPGSEFKFDYLKLDFKYTRNLPIDFLYYADIATKLKSIIPDLDILSLLPFVKNAKETYDRLQEERGPDLDNIMPSEEELNARIQGLLNASQGK